MYFKQLEMTGFKSFADRTIVRLEPGITAIVGPNGCGKSNILDALRWVLGEQRSKELRGTHMQDVLFNGSENRHAIGMAEVSVVFDNADSNLPVDFAEVQVTRRLYRSGESEYLVNKAPCRLKDINDIFMDTGIGTRAYSMVGQGKMDLILSQKPEDRRFLFEEAAGIIKYKNRKRLAMRRLESAEQNILRLTDIVAEIERQMRSLKRQVNAAIRYRELTEQLREIEIRAAWLKFTHLTARIAQLRRQFKEAQDSFESVSTQITTLEARHEELDLARLEIERVLLARRESVHEVDSEMERIESQIALLNQQIAFSQGQVGQADEERKAFEERAAEIEEQIRRTDALALTAREEIRVCADAIEIKTVEHLTALERVAEAETHLDAIRARSVERMSHRAKTQTELETLGVRIHAIEGQLQGLYERQTSEEQRRSELIARLDAARKQETEKHAALAELESRRAGIEEEQKARSEELRRLNERWQGLRERKSSLDARLNSLRELRDAYEGYATGVRAIMRAKAEDALEMSGVIGPAGDLISTDKAYERAIEAALGGNINNVIVEHAEAAKAAVRFLTDRAAGRVTFLPLDIIRPGAGDDLQSVKGRKGVVGPAIDCVRFDAHLRKAVEYLLHNTMLVETLDDAIAIARSVTRHPRLVTLDGEVVSPSGAVTGGRTKHEGRGLLGRSAEITELEGQIKSLDREIRETADQGASLAAAIQESTRDIQDLETSEGALRKETGEIGMTVARQSAELDSLGQSVAEVTAQCSELNQRREQIEAQRRDVLAQADSLDSDDEVFQRETAEAQESASQTRHASSVCQAELGDLRVKQAGLNQRIEELERDRNRERREYEEAVNAAERRREAMLQHQERQRQLEGAIRLQVERSAALSESKEEAHKEVVEAENQRQTLLDELETIDKELRGLREQSRTAQSHVHQLELDLRSSEDKVGFFQERVLTEYGIALHALKEEEVGADEYDEETRDRLVADIRSRLQRMGDVNLMAIEEYQALEKRHEFLAAQCQDLQQAREALLGVIARSDKRIREMFMETFEEVASHFREFFRRLFSGGQARVYLLDEDDPLESGIEIEARPPGKKPTSISLLSGGESALTAIALLFSILKSKPTPFCVLDEVDAPLDDANIGRFLSILDEFARATQFVIITHNKQTMARANAMYGVTMQERGVSQIISAKIEDAHDAESAA